MQSQSSRSRLIRAPSGEINLETAYAEAGGFGRYQILLVFLMSIFRNAGMSVIYGLATLISPQEYLCSVDPTNPDLLQSCSAATICAKRASGDFINYQVDTTFIGYVKGWEEEMDYLCTDPSKVAAMSSCYFIGFGIGMVLFPLPDLFGRRPAISYSVFGYLVAMGLLLAVPTIEMRSLALLMMGFFHLKNSSSYVMCFELVQEEYKSVVATTINCFDGATLLFVGIYFLFCKNWIYFNVFMFGLQLFCYILFLALVYESPKWLLLTGNKDEATRVLNKISSFNGQGATVDPNQTFVESRVDMSKSILILQRTQSLMQSNDSSPQEKTNITMYSQAWSKVSKGLKTGGFSDEVPVHVQRHAQNSQVFLQTFLICILQYFYILYFLVTEVKGEKTVFNMALGLGEFAGMFLSGLLLQRFSAKSILKFCVVCSIGSMMLLNIYGSTSPLMNYIGIFCSITAMSGCLNLYFILCEERIQPNILAAFLEISFCIATFCNLVVPFFLQKGLGFSTLVAIAYCPLMLILIQCFMPPTLKTVLSSNISDWVAASENLSEDAKSSKQRNSNTEALLNCLDECEKELMDNMSMDEDSFDEDTALIYNTPAIPINSHSLFNQPKSIQRQKETLNLPKRIKSVTFEHPVEIKIKADTLTLGP